MFTLRRVIPSLSVLRNGPSTINKLTASHIKQTEWPFSSVGHQHLKGTEEFTQTPVAGINDSQFTKISESNELSKFFTKVNRTIDSTANHRHFAVVYMYSKQKLVTQGDMFYLFKDLPASPGDRIKLEKIMLIGNNELTLVGRPLLDRNLAHVEATVIEKTHSHTFMGLMAKKRSHCFRRYYFQRKPLTILRINEIKICHHLNETQSILQ